MVKVPHIHFEQLSHRGIFLFFRENFQVIFVAFKALAVVHAEYFDLRQAFENAHQRVYFCRQVRFGHHGNIARLDTEKDRLI